MLYLVGLGLGDHKDITVRGLEAVRSCDFVYLEHYTSILMVDTDKLVELYGREVIVADREFVESGCEGMLEQARDHKVAFLVVGDPFAATTHSDLFLRARTMGVETEIIHNASIMSAVGATGLQMYRFGQTITIVYFTETWKPESFYDRLVENKKMDQHSLCLLDLKVKEQSIENLMKGNKVYEPPRFMTVNEAVEQLLYLEEKRGEGVCTPDTLAMGLARVGTSTQDISSGTLAELLKHDFGGPLHSLVICGSMHVLEQEMFDFYRIRE